jgi:hypothetical protein
VPAVLRRRRCQKVAGGCAGGATTGHRVHPDSAPRRGPRRGIRPLPGSAKFTQVVFRWRRLPAQPPATFSQPCGLPPPPCR